MQLLSDLEAALYSHQVKVVSPLEMAPSGKKLGGVKNFTILPVLLAVMQYIHPLIYCCHHTGREMLNTYFNPGKHKLWKMMRYTKLRLYK